MTREELKAKIDTISFQMAELEPARNKYQELSFERGKLQEEYNEKTYRYDLLVLKMKTKYHEPEYPYMGGVAENGSANFDNQEDAEKLVKLLRQRSYTYGYLLVWDGPGEYVVEPDYKYDHDGDVIYTATFKKETK
jgi:hypothetical protein